jgi:peptidyl-prolyl cis-trans isomerase B (cyclophilin B)
MADGGRRAKGSDGEERVEEGAVDEEEEDGAGDADEADEGDEDASASRERRPTRRRAERIAKAQEVRRRRNLKKAAIAVLIVSIIILASMLAYVYWPKKPETATVTVKTSTGEFPVTWSGKSNPVVVMATTMGTIELEIFMDKTPQTAGNFKHLVDKGFYDGLLFHRVIADFMIQGGDPSGDGSGGPGYSIDFETSAGQLNHLRGSISMARSTEKNSAGSQFFICVAPQTTLDGQYAVFGKVVKGMDVVDSISAVATNPDNDKPYTNIQMTDVHIK